jgi:hypothetical protein
MVDIYDSGVLSMEIDGLGVVSIFTMVTLDKTTWALDVSTFTSLHLCHVIVREDNALTCKVLVFIFFGASFFELHGALTSIFYAVLGLRNSSDRHHTIILLVSLLIEMQLCCWLRLFTSIKLIVLFALLFFILIRHWSISCVMCVKSIEKPLWLWRSCLLFTIWAHHDCMRTIGSI